jgi:hypothetical protein
MNSLFGNLFGDGVSRPAGTAPQVRIAQQTQLEKLKFWQELEEQKQRAANRYGVGLQADNALNFKNTMTAAQMQAWQKAQLEVQEAKAAEERRQAKEELEMPHNACSVSVAVDLWIVQYGDGWVYIGDIPETVGSGEMQWRELGKRLAGVNRMEARNNHWRIVT